MQQFGILQEQNAGFVLISGLPSGPKPYEEILTFLRKGTTLLKYGRHGQPKNHYFRLSSKDEELQWESKNGRIRRILLSSIKKFQKGQDTEVFRRYPQPLKNTVSFSIYYIDVTRKERTLDVICNNPSDFEMWFWGIQIIKYYPPSKILSARQPAEDMRKSQLVGSAESTARSVDDYRSSKSTPKGTTVPRVGGHSHAGGPGVLGPFIKREMGDLYVWGSLSPSDESDMHIAALQHQSRMGTSIGMDAMLNWQQSSKPVPVYNTKQVDVARAAVGTRHAALVTWHGELYTWGYGRVGNLGHGNLANHHSPRQVTRMRGKGTHSVSCSDGCSAAISSEGWLYTWGHGSAGQLGHGQHFWMAQPKRVMWFPDEVRIVQVSCGPYHTAAVSLDGSLFTWGDGLCGKLGHGDQNSSFVPRRVESLDNYVVHGVSCGWWHTAAIAAPRYDDSSRHHRAQRVTTASSVDYDSSEQSDTQSMGSFMQTEIGSLAASSRNFPAMPRLGGAMGPDGGRGGLSVSASTPSLTASAAGPTFRATDEYEGFTSTSNALFTWGGEFTWVDPGEGGASKGRKKSDSHRGCLGTGDLEGRLLPTRVRGEFDGKELMQVACGWNLTVTITSDGRVYQMGATGAYNPEEKSVPWEGCTSPTVVDSNLFGMFIEEVACGMHHVAVVASKAHPGTGRVPEESRRSRLLMWGKGGLGQLGNDQHKDFNVPQVVNAIDGRRILHVACGGNHTVAVCEHDPREVRRNVEPAAVSSPWAAPLVAVNALAQAAGGAAVGYYNAYAGNLGASASMQQSASLQGSSGVLTAQSSSIPGPANSLISSVTLPRGFTRFNTGPAKQEYLYGTEENRQSGRSQGQRLVTLPTIPKRDVFGEDSIAGRPSQRLLQSYAGTLVSNSGQYRSFFGGRGMSRAASSTYSSGQLSNNSSPANHGDGDDSSHVSPTSSFSGALTDSGLATLHDGPLANRGSTASTADAAYPYGQPQRARSSSPLARHTRRLNREHSGSDVGPQSVPLQGQASGQSLPDASNLSGADSVDLGVTTPRHKVGDQDAGEGLTPLPEFSSTPPELSDSSRRGHREFSMNAWHMGRDGLHGTNISLGAPLPIINEDSQPASPYNSSGGAAAVAISAAIRGEREVSLRAGMADTPGHDGPLVSRGSHRRSGSLSQESVELLKHAHPMGPEVPRYMNSDQSPSVGQQSSHGGESPESGSSHRRSYTAASPAAEMAAPDTSAMPGPDVGRLAAENVALQEQVATLQRQVQLLMALQQEQHNMRTASAYNTSLIQPHQHANMAPHVTSHPQYGRLHSQDTASTMAAAGTAAAVPSAGVAQQGTPGSVGTGSPFTPPTTSAAAAPPHTGSSGRRHRRAMSVDAGKVFGTMGQYSPLQAQHHSFHQHGQQMAVSSPSGSVVYSPGGIYNTAGAGHHGHVPGRTADPGTLQSLSNTGLDEPGTSGGSMSAAAAIATAAGKKWWVEEPDQGVYLWLQRHISGKPELFKIRFSKKGFNNQEATEWWNKNKEWLQERYVVNIHHTRQGSAGGNGAGGSQSQDPSLQPSTSIRDGAGHSPSPSMGDAATVAAAAGLASSAAALQHARSLDVRALQAGTTGAGAQAVPMVMPSAGGSAASGSSHVRKQSEDFAMGSPSSATPFNISRMESAFEQDLGFESLRSLNGIPGGFESLRSLGGVQSGGQGGGPSDGGTISLNGSVLSGLPAVSAMLSANTAATQLSPAVQISEQPQQQQQSGAPSGN